MHPELPRSVDQVSFSKPFYSHVGGYKLQLEIQRITHIIIDSNQKCRYKYRYRYVDSEFKVSPSTLYITQTLINKYIESDPKKFKLDGNIVITLISKLLFGPRAHFMFHR